MYCFGKGSSFGRYFKVYENVWKYQLYPPNRTEERGGEDGEGGEKEKVLILFVRLDAGFKFALIQL